MIDNAGARELRLNLVNRPLTTVASELVRLGGPRVTLPGVGYVVNDADLILEILRHEAFTCTGPGSLGGMITPVLGDSALFNMDGAGHRALKAQVAAALGKGTIGDSLDEGAAGLLAGLRHDLRVGRSVDLVALTRRLSNALICRLFGLRLPPEGQERAGRRMSQLGTTLTSYLRFERMQLSGAETEAAQRQCAELLQFAEQGFRDAGPDDPSLAGRLKRGGLEWQAARGMIAVLQLAATETISVALPRLVALLIDGGHLATLSADRTLLPDAIDEGLRVVCPSPAILRGVAYDVEVGGFRFRQGRRTILLLYNAVKGRQYGPAPRRFAIRRQLDPRLKRLWFGDGPHFCPGIAAARHQITSVLEVLLDQPGRLEIVGRGYPRGQTFPGYTTLLIRVRR